VLNGHYLAAGCLLLFAPTPKYEWHEKGKRPA
jgi:hypothetical protein